MSDRSTDLGYLLNLDAKLLRSHLSAATAPLGLTAQQASVLLAFAGDEPLRPSVIAERLGVDRPTITVLVDRLERDGWVETEADPDDGRARLVRPSGTGLAVAGPLREAAAEVSAAALSGLSDHEAATLTELLSRLADTLVQPPSAEGTP